MHQTFGKVLAAFSPLLSRLLDHHDYQTTTIDKLQKQIAMHRQIQDDDARRLHRGCDIDFLGPYDAFSPYSFQDCDADELPEQGEIYSWD